MCRLNKLCCFVLLALLSVPGGLFANSYKESIKKLHDQALVCNNILLSVDEKNKALKYQIRTQKAWHDPVFDVGYINMPLTEPYLGNSPMSGVEFRLSQKFPFFGKTNARAEVARAKFQVGKRQLEEKRNSILAQISSTYVSLVLNQQLKEITGEHLTALGQFRRSVESGYRVGKGKQFQVFRLITLQEQLEDDLLQFDADEQELLEKLTGEINCSDRRVINIAKTIPVVEPGKASEVPPSNPTLEVIKSQKIVELKSVDKFKRERLPDITPYVAYRIRRAVPNRDNGSDFISAGVSIPLTFFWNDTKYGSQVRAAKSNAKALEYAFKSELEKTSRELSRQHIRWRRNFQKAKTYEEALIPSARQTLDSALAAYGVGKTDFTDVYLAELELLNFERHAVKARANAAKAQIETNALQGVYSQKNQVNGDET